jgi:hypothetical protein
MQWLIWSIVTILSIMVDIVGIYHNKFIAEYSVNIIGEPWHFPSGVTNIND